MDLLTYIINNMPPGWNECFNYCQPDLIEISQRLHYESLNNIIFPFINEIFTIFYLLQPHRIKIVIIGQDPYQGIIKNSESYNNGIGIPICNGIAFSCRQGATIQPALRNILKEVKNNYPQITISNGDLTPWVKQGVFPLNTCLTVNKGISGSHGNMWEKFINKVINYLCYINPNIIFILWGDKAQKLQIPQNIRKIVGGHPSPLNRTGSFLGRNYFLEANYYLNQMGIPEINWST